MLALAPHAVLLLMLASPTEIPAHESATVLRDDGAVVFCVNATDHAVVVQTDARGPLPPDAACQTDGSGFRCASADGDRAGAFACSTASERAAPVVDVYLSTIATESLPDDVRALVESLVVGEAKRQAGIRVATIDELRRSLDDAAIAMADGCVSEACLPDVTRVLGARYAATAGATLVDGELSVTLALLDGKAGLAVAHETVHARRLDSFSPLLTVAVHNLFVPLTGRPRLAEPAIDELALVDDASTMILAASAGISASALLAAATLTITATGAVSWLVLEPDAPIVAAVWQVMALIPVMVVLPFALAGVILFWGFVVDMVGPIDLPLAHATTAASVAVVGATAGLLLGQAGGLGIGLAVLYLIATATGATDFTTDGALFRTYGGPVVLATPALVMFPIVVGTGLLTGGTVLATVALAAGASDFEGGVVDAE